MPFASPYLYAHASRHVRVPLFVSTFLVQASRALSLQIGLLACSMWPVRVSFSCPVARSQIFIVRSADPVTNHSLPGSTATERTHLQTGSN